MKTLLHSILRLLYRLRGYNTEVLNTPGPVVLIPNHVSWLDWLFLGVFLESDWKFVTSIATAKTSWLHRRIMTSHRTFPIDATSPYAVKRMAEYLQKGGRLVLFAEGRITTTGSLMKLFDGTGFLLHKTRAKVITAYLRGAVRIPWVRHAGWTRWFPEVSVHFSPVIIPPEAGHLSAGEGRQYYTQWLRQKMILQQFETEMQFGPPTVPEAVAEMARVRPGQIIIEDALLQPLTYRKLMVGEQLLAGALRPRLLPDQERVGVLLPNLNATPVLLLSLWRLDKTPAVLNFSSGVAVMLTCARLAGLKQIITSRRFLDRAKIEVNEFIQAGLDILYLEDIRSAITTPHKLTTLLKQVFWPGAASHRPKPECAVVLFTSGSEGMPKGVELTHRNIMANIRQMLSVTDIEDSDRLFNALPMFHSFGLTVATLLPLVRGLYVFFYPSPLHYRMVPAAVYDRRCTIFLSTNTFLNGYARKAHPYDFRGIRYLFAGAEKVQESTANLWARRFGTRILEGYGATECSPVISVNTPMAVQFGSTGQLMPGMECRLEPVEGVEEGGRLFVKGPNVMRGYLNPDANAHFQALKGWYDTGDIARLDSAGFIHLLGRLKRFAKVSGEMVSLTAVEDALAGAFPQYGLRMQVAILSRPDEEKGEALVAVSNEPKLTLEQIRSVLRAKGFSNLVIPREVVAVKEIPKLGTGKINHRQLEQELKEVAA